MDITLTINKSEVLAEVARTTSYIAAKMKVTEGTAGEYERIPTIDEDDELLTRFLQESKDIIISTFRNNVISSNGDWVLVLQVSDIFNTALISSIESSLFSFFVTTIIAKWLILLGYIERAAFYSRQAEMSLESISHSMCSHIGKLRRPLKPF